MVSIRAYNLLDFLNTNVRQKMNRLLALCLLGALSLTCDSQTPAAVPPRGQATAAPLQAQPGDGQAPMTLGAFRSTFLNQPVIVGDTPFDQSYCLEWNLATQKPDGTYAAVEGIDNHLPITYRGRTATVVSITLSPYGSLAGNPGGTNAFGEAITDDQISDPYMEITARFDDNTLAIVSGYPRTLVPDLIALASERSAAKLEIEQVLASAIGKPLYAVGYSKLYKSTATLDEITGPEELLYRLPVTSVPRLAPLVITRAKYLPELGGVLMELHLPDNSEALAYTPQSFIDLSQHDPLQRIAGTLLSSMPSLTPREIEAVKKVELFRGMSEQAVSYSLGFSDSVNDWGLGGKQFVYFHGTLLIYVGQDGKVRDWQNLGDQDN